MFQAMEDNNEAVMGYPVEFLMVQSGRNERGAAAAAIPDLYDDTPPPSPQHVRRCCSCLYYTILAATAALIMAILGGIFWVLSMHQDPKFQVNSVTVSAFNVSASNMTANWNVNLSVSNPNVAVKLYYEDVRVSVLYEGRYHLFSAINIPKFQQHNNEETWVEANVSARSLSIDKSVAKAIAVARRNGYLDFTVTLDATIRFHFLILKDTSRKFVVFCEDMKVRFFANTTLGKTLDGPKECKAAINPKY